MHHNISQYVDNTIQNAIDQKASDIHFEPYKTSCRIRFRIDGLLHETEQLLKPQFEQVIARIKILSNLNIAEKRLPQDGHFSHEKNLKTINIRVNCCPTYFGEKIVLRILDIDSKIREIDSLGFHKKQKQIFTNAISKPQGLILITGPTGSGKSTTLYAALNHLNTLEKNIVTVEDPVEINIAGINQIHVCQKIGLTFSEALRALLRQDPDIMMIGEIRDLETAEIAIKAALTGHLVFSTLHTNSALKTINRLKHMGIPEYQIDSALQLVTAQRLIRTLCHKCKTERMPTLVESETFNIPRNTKIYQATGCPFCHQGYLGRIAIHEIFPINKEPKTKLFSKLEEIAIQHVLNGETTLEEINRVL